MGQTTSFGLPRYEDKIFGVLRIQHIVPTLCIGFDDHCAGTTFFEAVVRRRTSGLAISDELDPPRLAMEAYEITLLDWLAIVVLQALTPLTAVRRLWLAPSAPYSEVGHPRRIHLDCL